MDYSAVKDFESRLPPMVRLLLFASSSVHVDAHRQFNTAIVLPNPLTYTYWVDPIIPIWFSLNIPTLREKLRFPDELPPPGPADGVFFHTDVVRRVLADMRALKSPHELKPFFFFWYFDEAQLTYGSAFFSSLFPPFSLSL